MLYNLHIMPDILSKEALSGLVPDRRGEVGSKFIAVPGFIIVDAFSHAGLLDHWEAMTQRQPELLEEALKEVEEKQLGICGEHSDAEEFAMFDAGYLTVKPSALQIEEVVISERSRDYGCAMNDTGRPETVRIAQAALGQDISVTMTEHY